MKITFLGGADEVGASSILIEMGGRRVLVDAGIRPSPKARWGLAGDQLPHLAQLEAAGGVDAVLVTHAHTDHTGALELVAGRYPSVPFYATQATIALTRVLHADARRIMKTRFEEEGELPLFDEVAVEKLMDAFVAVPFGARLPLGEGLAATFFPAGHIAGAAMIGLESDEGRVLVSGDISISPQRTVDGAKAPPFIPDVLILESTYGGRLHANRAVQERSLVEKVGEVTSSGGKVLIPAFALGRAQELLLILGEFRRRGALPPVPVWADGMVRAICQAYASFPEFLPLPLQERGARFFDEVTRPVGTVQERNALVWESSPAVIIASSGMLAGGPSLSYARALAGKPQHAILLTGYQDEESPGRRLQELAERGSGTLRLGKDKIDVQCRLGTYSLSAHADEGQLTSLVETLNPRRVFLVHGDEAARASLESALSARRRDVYLPRSGQTYELHFPRTARSRRGPVNGGRPLDLRRLWQEADGPSGGFFELGELAGLWWGTRAEEHTAELASAVAADDLYFRPDPRWKDVYRAQTPAEIEATIRRREQLAALPPLAGQWLVLSGPAGTRRLGRCVRAAGDHLWVEIEGEAEQLAWPEEVVTILGHDLPQGAALEEILQPSRAPAPGPMEPNQALAFAAQLLPPEARLRRSGYRIAEKTLVLNFDFPDSATEKYAGELERLQKESGWHVEIAPEANQAALNSLARQALPEGWRILKGPSIHRETRRVALTVRPPSPGDTPGHTDLLAAAQHNFRVASGYELAITIAEPAVSSLPVQSIPTDAGAARWEINAAYGEIKRAFEGRPLHRTSQKGDEIVLTFISPQVGERYLQEIQDLSRRIGWPLSLNPQPNQAAVLESARTLLERTGRRVTRGPGIYVERGEVVVTLAGEPTGEELAGIQSAFQEATGYRLSVNFTNSPGQTAASSQDSLKDRLEIEQAVEIPVERIRLRPYHQQMVLNPDKLEKTIERARRVGQVNPPVRVRRTQSDYLLEDGLYRLQAAKTLGLERILAVVE